MLGGNNLGNMLVLGGPMDADPAPSTGAAPTGCLGLPAGGSAASAAALARFSGKAPAAKAKAADFQLPAFTKTDKPKRTKKLQLSCTMFACSCHMSVL